MIITNKEEAINKILEQEIVAIFQKSSEYGPRALGNRSLLFDPRNKNGKDIVNKVKRREWFRPFAELIEEFYKRTNVPILFNTSFNLAGEPLVETLSDAHSTIERSDLKYLYLPDLQSQSSGQ